MFEQKIDRVNRTLWLSGLQSLRGIHLESQTARKNPQVRNQPRSGSGGKKDGKGKKAKIIEKYAAEQLQNAKPTRGSTWEMVCDCKKDGTIATIAP